MFLALFLAVSWKKPLVVERVDLRFWRLQMLVLMFVLAFWNHGVSLEKSFGMWDFDGFYKIPPFFSFLKCYFIAQLCSCHSPGY